MLNFVLCDDNLNMLNKLSTMLENIFIKNDYDAEISFTSDDADSILGYVNSHKADVLFLDINLKSKMSGLELAERVRQKNKNCYIVFTTGHLEYAMIAYKFKTFDYLPKPVTSARLEDTVVRLFEDINGMPNKYIKIDSKNTLVNEDEIKYIKRDGMKLVFHTDSRDYETYSSFNKIQEQLPNNFIRCHKSYVANINKIVNIEPSNNIVLFDNESQCDIGPKYKSSFMEVMKNYEHIT